MKAAVYFRYGPPEVVQIADIERPIPKDDEVIIKVSAASVNPYDWHFMRGTPYVVRLMAGISRPKFARLGVDAAGTVEAIGSNVKTLKPGDEVFGGARGAFAEYACASERALVMKPPDVSFEQAASAPIAAITALQGLRDKGHIQPGHKVLVNGAAGGVGTFAVQIAKSYGAEVTGVCSTRNVEMVRSIGAERTIDYTREDFTHGADRYDIILDCVGNHSLAALRRVLAPRGICVGAGGSSDPWMIGPIVRAIASMALSAGSRKMTGILANLKKPGDLTALQELLRTGKVRPVIDRRYRLREVPEAIRYLEAGHARGKVIITIDESSDT